jgi:ribosome-associated protein
MLHITRNIAINENEITFSFIRSSGPGGQNVNKVATAAQLRFDVKHSSSLPEAVKKRLIRLGGSRMTDEGVLTITAQRFRTQERNRIDGLERLTELIRKAATPPKPRRKTRPPKKSIEKRLQGKKNRSKIKKLRQTNVRSDD